MVTVTTQVPPPAAALQVAGDTEYGALSPLSVNSAAWLPLLVNVTLPLAAAAPLTASSAEAPFELTETPLPLIVPDTAALAGPVVPPAAVRVCAPWAPRLPPVVMLTVTTQVPPPAATLQVAGDTV